MRKYIQTIVTLDPLKMNSYFILHNDDDDDDDIIITANNRANQRVDEEIRRIRSHDFSGLWIKVSVH